MKFEELQQQWANMKPDEALQRFSSQQHNNNIMDTIRALEIKATKSRRQMEWGLIPVIPMAVLFIYFFTWGSWVASIGLALVVLAIMIVIYQSRQTKIKLEGHDQQSLAFLKEAKQKLQSRIWMSRVLMPIYMIVLTVGIFMYLSHILADVSPTFWWMAHASVVLYGIFIYMTTRKKSKQWLETEVQPIIADIDKILKE